MSVVIVTGGACGIGKAVVERLVEASHKVVFCDVNEIAGKETESDVGGTFVRADVTVETDWKHLVEKTVDLHGKVDVLVNNAGVGFPPDASNEHRALMKTLEINVGGAQLGISAVTPYLQERGGVVINVSSIASASNIKATGKWKDYAISKAALDMLTRGVSSSYREGRIRCYSLNPWLVDTHIASLFGLPIEKLSFTANPVGTVIKPKDIAPVFLNAITGDGKWKYPNGCSVGVFLNKHGNALTVDMAHLYSDVHKPSDWAFNDSLLSDTTQLCDETGNPLSREEAKDLRIAISSHKNEVSKLLSTKNDVTPVL